MATDTDAPAFEPGAIVGEKYRIERHIGRGGMGSVYEAANTLTEKRVALKLITPEQRNNTEVRARLMREARIAARVEHPNVVDIYDVGVEGDSVFLVMELLHGQALSEWLEERRPVQPLALIEVILSMLKGLVAMHDAGVIHRDLKPGNVFVVASEHEPRPRAKLLDFGIARDRSAETLTLTQPGQILGTPAYMAPEQLDAPETVDVRTDVYACGVLLYESFAGVRPFRSESLTSLIAMVLAGKPEPLGDHRPDLPKELVKVIERAMARDPESRYPDASSLAAALAPFGPKDAWTGSGLRVPPAQPSGSGGRVVTAIVTVAALAVLGTVLYSMDLGEADPETPVVESPPATETVEAPPPEVVVVPMPIRTPILPVEPPVLERELDLEEDEADPDVDEPGVTDEEAAPRPRARRRPPRRPRPVTPPRPSPQSDDGLQLDPDDF